MSEIKDKVNAAAQFFGSIIDQGDLAQLANMAKCNEDEAKAILIGELGYTESDSVLTCKREIDLYDADNEQIVRATIKSQEGEYAVLKFTIDGEEFTIGAIIDGHEKTVHTQPDWQSYPLSHEELLAAPVLTDASLY